MRAAQIFTGSRFFPVRSCCYGPMPGQAGGQPPFPERATRCRATNAFLAFLCLIAVPAAGAARNPEKVPDHLAVQHFLLAFSVPASPSPVELKRQEAQLASLGLGADERAVMKQELARFRAQWEELDRQWSRAGQQSQPEEQSRALSAIAAARSGLSVSAISRIRGLLSPESGERVDRHIQTRVKSRIIICGSAN